MMKGSWPLKACQIGTSQGPVMLLVALAPWSKRLLTCVSPLANHS